MAQIKASAVDAYCRKPDPRHRVVLIYGPDRGAVSETAGVLAKASGVALDDAFSTIRLDLDDVAADPMRLADEVFTVPMFAGNRLIWLRGSTQRSLAPALKPVLDDPPSDVLVLIEAGDLKRGAALRTLIEKSARGVALPCYADEGRTIDRLVDEELATSGATLLPDARRLLHSMLGGDRLASRQELAKLALYAQGQSTIDSDDVLAVVGDASALAIDRIVDAVANGDRAGLESALQRLVAQGVALHPILAAIQRHFQALHQARCLVDAGKGSARSVVEGLRPPVHFKRKDVLVRAVSQWSLPRLERALERINATMMDMRTDSAMAMPALSTTLLALTIESDRARR